MTPEPDECFRCRKLIASREPRYHLRIGFDHAPAFDGPAPDHPPTVEEETLYEFCARCYAAVDVRVNELLTWLWDERPESAPTPAPDACRQAVVLDAAQAGELGAS